MAMIFGAFWFGFLIMVYKYFEIREKREMKKEEMEHERDMQVEEKLFED